ncbi:MAG: MFS transporter [Candidatus Hydrogenedentales bacterium]|jgi:GPH family glycoside/pentoside/hexuronide:cation symporter
MGELSFRQRLAFGMAGITMNLPDMILMQWLLVRYVRPDTTQPLVPPLAFGAIMLMGRILEAIANPIVGHWSDQTRTKWGRRMPYLRLGIVPFALVFFLLFSPPVDHLHWINVAWVFVLLPLYLFLYAVIITPYLALLPEISSNLKERVDLTTYQSVFIMLGMFLFAAMGIILNQFGWTALAALVAGLALAFFLPVCTLIREKAHPAVLKEERFGLLESARLALKNQPFRCVFGATALFLYGLNGLLVLVPVWVLSYLGRDEGSVTLLMLPFLLVNLSFFFVFNAFAGKFGKYRLMQVTFLAGAAVIASIALVGVFPFGSEFMQTAIFMSLFGIPAAGFMVLPFAILADVVDYDEKVTGRRREALFVGGQGVAQKLMIGLSVLSFTIVPYLGSDGSRILREGGALEISGVYTPSDGVAVAADPTQAKRTFVPGAIYIVPRPASLAAPWKLTGPEGLVREGKGVSDLTDMPPGKYAIEWLDAPGWTKPEPGKQPTPFGLKLMAILCGLACVCSFLVFLRYPIREKDGKAYFVGQT